MDLTAGYLGGSPDSNRPATVFTGSIIYAGTAYTMSGSWLVRVGIGAFRDRKAEGSVIHRVDNERQGGNIVDFRRLEGLRRLGGGANPAPQPASSHVARGHLAD